VLDDRVLSVLARLEAEDAGVEPATGRFLFALVAPQTDCEVLEIGAARGYSTLWLAAGVRYLGGRVLSLEGDHACIADWRHHIMDAGLEETAELVEGDPLETLTMIDDVFDVVVLPAAQRPEELFALARERLEPAALIVAAGGAAPREDPALMSTTVPLDRGLDLSVVLR
jgi:predicted O-methyltransferase YrrM